jgi:hypothetical protein
MFIMFMFARLCSNVCKRARHATDSTLRWDAVATFPTLAAAASFALDVGEAPALVAREVSVHQAPTFSHHLRDTPLGRRLAAAETETEHHHHHTKHVVLVQIAGRSAAGPLSRLATDVGGEVLWVERSADAEVPLYEYAWNHTTLHALKSDKNVTYLQAAMMPGKCTELVSAVESSFGGGGGRVMGYENTKLQ